MYLNINDQLIARAKVLTQVLDRSLCGKINKFIRKIEKFCVRHSGINIATVLLATNPTDEAICGEVDAIWKDLCLLIASYNALPDTKRNPTTLTFLEEMRDYFYGNDGVKCEKF